MKNFKKLLALGLSAITVASVAVFAGCKGGHTDNDDKQSAADSSGQPSGPSDNPVDPPVEGGTSGDAEKAERLANSVAELKKFLKTAAEIQNFTYADKAPQTDLKLEFEGQKLKKTEKGTVTFYESTATGETFCYTATGDGWDKDFSGFDIAGRMDSVKNMANSISWTELEQSGNLIGKISNGNTNAKVTAQLSQNAAKMVIKAEVTEEVLEDLTIEKVGSTTVTIPNEKITDKTVDASDLLYTEVNGERIWNVKLIADTIENWMPADYYQKLCNVESKLNKVLSVDYKDGKLLIGTYMEGTRPCFQMFKTRPEFDTAFNQGKIKTVDNLVEYLNAYKFSLIKDSAETVVDYATGIDATEDEEKEFAILSQNIVERLYKIGTQPYGAEHDIEVEKHQELTGGKVVFGCMGPLVSRPAGLDIGNCKAFEVVLIVNVDNEYKLLKAEVCSSIDLVGNGKINVLKDSTNKNWVIPKCEIEDMSKENAVLYENA